MWFNVTTAKKKKNNSNNNSNISFPFFKLPVVKQVASKPDGYPVPVIFENVAEKPPNNTPPLFARSSLSLLVFPAGNKLLIRLPLICYLCILSDGGGLPVCGEELNLHTPEHSADSMMWNKRKDHTRWSLR